MAFLEEEWGTQKLNWTSKFKGGIKKLRRSVGDKPPDEGPSAQMYENGRGEFGLTAQGREDQYGGLPTTLGQQHSRIMDFRINKKGREGEGPKRPRRLLNTRLFESTRKWGIRRYWRGELPPLT